MGMGWVEVGGGSAGGAAAAAATPAPGYRLVAAHGPRPEGWLGPELTVAVPVPHETWEVCVPGLSGLTCMWAWCDGTTQPLPLPEPLSRPPPFLPAPFLPSLIPSLLC